MQIGGKKFNITPLHGFCYPLNYIRVIRVHFGFVSFSFSFFQYTLDEDIRHVNALSRLGKVQGVFMIFFNVLHKTFLICFVFFCLFRTFNTSSFPLTQTSCKFSKDFQAHVLFSVHKPFWCVDTLLSPFLMEV